LLFALYIYEFFKERPCEPCLCTPFTLPPRDSCVPGDFRLNLRQNHEIQWLKDENKKRSAYYSNSASQLLDSINQQRSNYVPHIKLFKAQSQLLASLELNPSDIAFVCNSIFDFLRIYEHHRFRRNVEHMIELFGLCALKVPDLFNDLREKLIQMARFDDQALSILRHIDGWKSKDLDEIDKRRNNFIQDSSSLRQFLETPACKYDFESLYHNIDINSNPVLKPIFSTFVSVANFEETFHSDFLQKLSRICVEKYREFSLHHSHLDFIELNDEFYDAQTGNSDFWPELWKSEEYKKMESIMRKSLNGFAKDLRVQFREEDTFLEMWAAIYLEETQSRHDWHTHAGSYASCVFYVDAPDKTTPIIFADPRGTSSFEDFPWNNKLGFEPEAPFHHPWVFFPQSGDMVCFPSWLVHRVPTHSQGNIRVAFAANLASNKVVDAWAQSASL